MRKLIVLVSILAMVSPVWADYKSTILSDNPLGFWEFEDASSADGAPCADSAAGGISPGQYRNIGASASGIPDIALVSGKPGLGKAAYFNGTGGSGYGNCVQIFDSSYSNNYRLESSPTCTIEFWENAPTTASETYGRFISHASGGTGNYWVGMTSTGDNAGQPFVAVPGGTWYAWPPTLADSAWHLVDVVYTYDGTNTTAELYIDGTSRGTNAAAGAFAPPGDWQDLLIGAENNVYWPFNGLIGAMDEVAYYNYALSADWVAAHFPEPATIALLGLGLALLRKRS
jgi:hypothetical protein